MGEGLGGGRCKGRWRKFVGGRQRIGVEGSQGSCCIFPFSEPLPIVEFVLEEGIRYVPLVLYNYRGTC